MEVVIAFLVGVVIGASVGVFGVCMVALREACKNDKEYLDHLPE